MPWPKQTQLSTMHTAHLGLPDKDRAVKGLVVYDNWDLDPLYMLNGLAYVVCCKALRDSSNLYKTQPNVIKHRDYFFSFVVQIQYEVNHQ